MTKPISVERGLEISSLSIVLGAVLLLVGVADALDWSLDLGGWGFYAGAAGVLVMIVGVVWTVSIFQRRWRFSVLMGERSKAAFVRSLDEIEYAAWRLPSKYDELLADKKREMGVK
ncbi:MAG: hypothetical protein GXY70_01940 [Euryarchaeota archaeon]|jgi:membrane protein YdbS with pleckstrin-like domain|nr:hypothetical protein [Euryarchaeota archaeon]